MRVDKNKMGQTRQPACIMFLVSEMTVISVLAPFQTMPTSGVGEEVSDMFMSDNDYFYSDLKKYLAGAFGVPIEQVDDADGLVAWGVKADERGELVPDLDDVTKQQKQPMRGMVLEYNNRVIVGDVDPLTKRNKEFTKKKVVREVPPEEVLAKLSAEDVLRFFPGEYLQRAIAARKAPAAA